MTTEEAVLMFLRDIPLINRIANGGPTDVVETDDGPVRSVAKLIADKDAEISAAFADFSAAVTGVGAERALAEVAASGASASLAAALAAGKVFDNANQAATSTTPVVSVGDTAWIRPNPTDGLKRLTATKRIDAGTTIASFANDQSFGTGDEFDALARSLGGVSTYTDVNRFTDSVVSGGYYAKSNGLYQISGTWASIKIPYNSKHEYRYTGVGNASTVASVAAYNSAGAFIQTLVSSASETGRLIDPSTVPANTASLGISAVAAQPHSLVERTFSIDSTALGSLPADVAANATRLGALSKPVTVDHFTDADVSNQQVSQSGVITGSTSWRTTPLIPYNPKATYVYTGFGHATLVASVSAWAANGSTYLGTVYLNGAQAVGVPITPAMVPANTAFLRATAAATGSYVRAFNETAYVVDQLALGAIPSDLAALKANYVVETIDYAASAVLGYIGLTGALVADTGTVWRSTPFAPVSMGATYTFTGFGNASTVSSVSMWDANKQFLGTLYTTSAQVNGIPITVTNPACKYLRASGAVNSGRVFAFVVVAKHLDPSLVADLQPIKDDVAALKANAPSAVRNLIPKVAYAQEGRPLYLKLRGMVGDDSVDVSCNLPLSNKLAVPITPSSTADIGVTIQVLGRNGAGVEIGSFFIKVTGAAPVSPAVPRTYIHIGDSTVDCIVSSSISGAVINEVSRQLTGFGTSVGTNPPAPLMLTNMFFRGTRGTGPVKHEGRPGWDIDDYMTLGTKTIAGVTLNNAFWNASTQAFDIDFYIANNGWDAASTATGVLANGSNLTIILQCTWNDFYDTAPAVAAAKMGAWIDLIKAKKPQAKIIVMGLNPAPDLNYKAYVGTRFVSRLQVFQGIVEFTNAYVDMLASRPGCEFLGLAHQFEPEIAYPKNSEIKTSARSNVNATMFTDHVHPEADGYAQYSDAIVLKILHDDCRGV